MSNDYLTLAEVIAMQRQLIDRFGGSHGIREMGALESAVLRPQMGYSEDLIAEAAALMEIDRNKTSTPTWTLTRFADSFHSCRHPSRFLI